MDDHQLELKVSERATRSDVNQKGFPFPHLCLFTYKNVLLNISADMFMVRICGSMKTSLVLSPLIHFFSHVQDSCGDTEEETSWQEADGIQDPCAQCSFPSICQGNQGAFLVTRTQLSFFIIIYAVGRAKLILTFPPCISSSQYIWGAKDCPSSKESGWFRKSSRFWLCWFPH